MLGDAVEDAALAGIAALIGEALGDVQDVDLIGLRVGEVEVLAGVGEDPGHCENSLSVSVTSSYRFSKVPKL